MKHYEEAKLLAQDIARALGYEPQPNQLDDDPVLVDVYWRLRHFGNSCLLRGGRLEREKLGGDSSYSSKPKRRS